MEKLVKQERVQFIRKVASPHVQIASQYCTAQGNLTLLYSKKSGDFFYTIKKEGKRETHTTLKSNFQLLTSNSGITLIALVVTIVVLLILAGITINLVLADGGIFGKAEEASEAQRKAEVEDKVGLILADALVEKATYGTELKEYLQKENIPIVAEDDETITIEVDGYTVVIDKETFEIVNIEENAKSVRISLDSKTAKLNVVVNCEIGLGDDMAVLAWSYVASDTEIGEDETQYANKYTTSPLNLKGETEGEYYLHLLVEDKKEGSKKEYIKGPVLVGNYVESISLDKTELELEVGGTESLAATALPNDASNTNVKWKSSNEEVATVSSEETASGVAITVTAIGAGTAVITAEAADGSGKSLSCEVIVERSGNIALDPNKYTWEVMNKIAKEISNNYGTGEGKYNKATERVQLTLDNEEYDIMVGDTLLLTDTSNNTSHTVRILGFNHDKLTNTAAYGGNNTYAGISFEFVTFLTRRQINSSTTNIGGWGATAIRKTLNENTVTTLDNNAYIKEVEKSYIATYNEASSVTTSSDKLWLLSCSEIWNNGYGTGYYGFAVTNESTMYNDNDIQTQYKYYVINLGSLSYDSFTVVLKKGSGSYADYWWLRSLESLAHVNFSIVHSSGGCTYMNPVNSYGIAPGFSI